MSDVVRFLNRNSEVNEEEFKELSKKAYNSTQILKNF